MNGYVELDFTETNPYTTNPIVIPGIFNKLKSSYICNKAVYIKIKNDLGNVLSPQLARINMTPAMDACYIEFNTRDELIVLPNDTVSENSN